MGKKSTRSFLKQLGASLTELEDVMERIIDDDTLSQQFIDDGGESMKQKQKSILEQAQASVTKLEAEVRELRARRDLAEEALRASRLPKEDQPIVVPTGNFRHGKEEFMTVTGTTKAREIGERWYDSPENQAAVRARLELSEAHTKLMQARAVVAKIERQARDLKALQACVDLEAA